MISSNEERVDVNLFEYVFDEIIESIFDEMIDSILDEMIESTFDSVLKLFISNNISKILFDVSSNATIFEDEFLIDFATSDEFDIVKFSYSVFDVLFFEMILFEDSSIDIIVRFFFNQLL